MHTSMHTYFNTCFVIFVLKVTSQKNGLVVKVLDSQSRGPMFKKPLGGSKVHSAFHPSEVDKVSTRNFWGLSGKK